jgi:hypothetical protein
MILFGRIQSSYTTTGLRAYLNDHVLKGLRDEKCHSCIVPFLEFDEKFSTFSWPVHQAEQHNNGEVRLVLRK